MMWLRWREKKKPVRWGEVGFWLFIGGIWTYFVIVATFLALLVLGVWP